MRLSRLVFHRVGLWQELPPVSLGPHVTIVLGDNEAGKSTSMRAIEALLFGTSPALVAPLTSELAFHASATLSFAGEPDVVLTRRRKHREPATLPNSLAALLALQNRSRFTDLFRIAHAELKPEKNFLAETGALGRFLFAASSGTNPSAISDLDERIEKRIKTARSGARTTTGLGRRLDEFKAQLEELDKRARFGAFDERFEAHQRLEAQNQRLLLEIRAADEQAHTLRSLARGLPIYEELEHERRMLGELERSGPIAPEPWPDMVERLEHARLEAAARLDEARERASVAHEELQAAPPASPIVAFSSEIEQLVTDLGRVEADSAELAREEIELRKWQGELAARLRALGARPNEGALLQEAEALLLSPPRLRSLHETIRQGDALTLATKTATSRLASAKDDLARAERASAERPLASTTELERAAKVVEALATDESAARKSRELARAAREQARIEAGKLGLGAAADESLASTRVAQPDTLKHAHDALRAAEEQVARVAASLETARAQLRAQEAETAQLAAGFGEIPSAERLAEARGERSSAWALLASTWSPKLADDAAAALPERAARFSRTLFSADEIADRRFAEAGRIGQWEASRALVAKQQSDVERAERQHEAALAALQANKQAWSALWPFLPAPPIEYTDWLVGFRSLVERLLEADRADHQARELDAQLARRRHDVTTLLGDAHVSLAALQDTTTLGRAIEALLAERKSHNQHASELRAQCATRSEDLRQAESQLALAEQAEARWATEWHALSATLPASVGSEPSAVSFWLERHEQLQAAAEQVRQLEGSVSERHGSVRAFAARVAELAARVREAVPGFDLPEVLAPVDTSRELARRAKEAAAQQRVHERARAEQLDAERRVQKDEAELSRRRARLDEAFREAGLAGAATGERLALECERARAAHRHRTRIATLSEMLRGAWPNAEQDGVTAVAGRTQKELQLAAADAEQKRESLEKERESVVRDIGVESQRLRTLGVEASEESSAQALADARAQVFERADEVIYLEAARLLLTRAKQLATRDDRPLLERASALFSQLTGGAYEALDIDRQGAEPTLHAIAGSEVKSADQLSDGTKDQLWLALRLAVVAQAAIETPFPLLLDDVFVHFDDQRTLAALRALRSLSEHVQVLVFTHHDHVVDLARRAIPDGLEVVTLARPEAPPRTRALPEELVRHPRPAAPTLVIEEAAPTRAGSISVEAAEDIVLALLRAASTPLSKLDLVKAAREQSVDLESVWTQLIARLKGEGRIVQEGEKRGARYAIGAGATEHDT